MRQVFISYSSKDFTQAQAVRGVLEQNGITCWMAPADIPGGSNYTKEIPLAIKGCQAFVLILSANAQSSHWVLKELDSAVNAGKIILPFQLEDVPLSDEFNFLLTGAQRYDAYQKKSEALKMLVSRIKAIIAASEQHPEAPEQPAAPVHVPETPRQEPPRTVPKSEPFGAHCCPACGSIDVVRLEDKIIPRDAWEFGMSVLFQVGLALALPVGVLIAGAILTVILEMIPGLDPDIAEAMMYITMVLELPSVVCGVILGKRITGERIRRRRLRRRIQVGEYTCNACKKKFPVVAGEGTEK